MKNSELSKADYLVDLCMKYFFRAVLSFLILGIFVEGLMKLEALRHDRELERHVWQLVLEVLPDQGSSIDGQAGGSGDERGLNFTQELIRAGWQSLKVSMLAMSLVLGVGLPLGMIAGRLASAGQGRRSGWRLLGRIFLLPCQFLYALPAFVLAVLLLYYLLDVTGVPVFEWMQKGSRGFDFWNARDTRTAGWWRLLLPAGAVALSAASWLAKEVAQVLRAVREQDFVRAAERRGVFGDHLYFHYVVKNSLRDIGGALLRVLPFLLASLILIEWVFRFPGLGEMVFRIATDSDFGRIFVTGFVLMMMVGLGGFFLEAMFGLLDGKTREQGGLSVMSALVDQPGAVKNPVEAGGARKRQTKMWRRLKQAYLGVFLLLAFSWGIKLFADFRWEAESGSESLIRSDLWRVLIAANETLVMSGLICCLSLCLAFFVSAVLGGLGGWRAYCLVARIHSALWALPLLFVMLVALPVVGAGYWSMVWLLVVISAVLGVGVLSRWFLDIESRPWVEAARATGLRPGQIFFRHFIPVIWPRVLARVLLLFPLMLVAVTALDFSLLQEGAENAGRWGTLLAEGRQRMWQDPDLLVFLSLALWGAVVFFDWLGMWAKTTSQDRVGPDVY
ncbi:MAG: ABC transporter permease subunit [Verrucomicrobiota bacterium]